MAEQPAVSATGSTTHAASPSNPSGSAPSAEAPKRPAIEGNPALRALGIPRLRLPSRNWTIFLSVIGSFAGAVIYDKWQTRRIREKWLSTVSHIAAEPLSVRSMPRKLTVYLAAPPGDGLRSAREHFHEYVKPVLVAAAMDWDVVEGRKEGDVRFKTAERIRRRRRRAGEGTPPDEDDAQHLLQLQREKTGTTEYDGVAGDLVIGRHTWKEYVKGLHEGWLGPADAPPSPETAANENAADKPPDASDQPSARDASIQGAARTATDDTGHPSTEASGEPGEPLASKPAEDEKKEEEKPKPRNPQPYIDPSDYQTAQLSSSTPETIGPVTAIRFPHILGFRNTPIRMYRFLTRRRLADDVGRQVAAAVLAASYRPYSTVTTTNEDSASSIGVSVPEQSQMLAFEEKSWWKTVREPRKEHEESVWLEDVKLDQRIASRMRVFELTDEDKDGAERMAEPKFPRVLPPDIHGLNPPPAHVIPPTASIHSPMQYNDIRRPVLQESYQKQGFTLGSPAYLTETTSSDDQFKAWNDAVRSKTTRSGGTGEVRTRNEIEVSVPNPSVDEEDALLDGELRIHTKKRPHSDTEDEDLFVDVNAQIPPAPSPKKTTRTNKPRLY